VEVICLRCFNTAAAAAGRASDMYKTQCRWYTGDGDLIATLHILSSSYKYKMKKRSERCKHCTLAVVRPSQKNFAPPQTPFLGARDGRNLISWRWSLPLPTNPIWWGSMHAISSYRVNRPTHKQTGPITIHCAAARVQCNDCNSTALDFRMTASRGTEVAQQSNRSCNHCQSSP